MPRSRRQPDPADLKLFIDRNLGTRQIPDALRSHGCTVHTLASVYGIKAGERVPDVEWLAYAGRNDFVVLTKDRRILRRTAELAVVQSEAVRMFVITRGDLTAEQQLERIEPNLYRIAQKAQKSGPFVCGLYSDRIRQLWPKPAQ